MVREGKGPHPAGKVSLTAEIEAQLLNLSPQAAKNAGIHPITLIKEPEAAALYTLHFLKNKALSVSRATADATTGESALLMFTGRRRLCSLRCRRRYSRPHLVRDHQEETSRIEGTCAWQRYETKAVSSGRG